MKINDIVTTIINGHYTNEELTKIINAVKVTRDRMAKVNTFTMRVGLDVTFTNKGVQYKGIVSKINRSTINVTTDKGTWKVPANMLTVAE